MRVAWGLRSVGLQYVSKMPVVVEARVGFTVRRFSGG